jgi:regulator of RNase E activity RraA
VEAFGQYTLLKVQVPIRIPGELTETIVVHPGDFIFREDAGVIVMPKDLTFQVLEEYERIKRLENEARRDFARGDDPVDVFQSCKRF